MSATSRLQEEYRHMKEQKDAAYVERNKCVALMARMAAVLGYPVYRAHTRIPGWDPDWCNCIFIELPTGQVSWHYHNDERPMFIDFMMATGNPWDGHDTLEKYRRALAYQEHKGQR